MTDNQALTRLFQAKQRVPKLWNFCDQALQLNFILAHVPGIENPAADYLSRLNVTPADRVHLKLTDSIPTHRIAIDKFSKTPKQVEDEDEFNHNDLNSPDPTTPTSLPERKIDVILIVVTKCDGETNDGYRCRKVFVKQQLARHVRHLSRHRLLEAVFCKEFKPPPGDEPGRHARGVFGNLSSV